MSRPGGTGAGRPGGECRQRSGLREGRQTACLGRAKKRKERRGCVHGWGVSGSEQFPVVAGGSWVCPLGGS